MGLKSIKIKIELLFGYVALRIIEKHYVSYLRTLEYFFVLKTAVYSPNQVRVRWRRKKFDLCSSKAKKYFHSSDTHSIKGIDRAAYIPIISIHL